MNQEPLISVIVPVYWVENYLKKCVDSILTQTYTNLELILVDDGSPDQSGAICDAYAQKDKRVRVIHKENGGLSSARNAGLDAARGDFVAFVDSDDWIVPDTYEAMVAAAEKYQVCLVCAGRYDVVGSIQEIGLCPEQEEVISGQELAGRIFRWDHMDSAAVDKLYGRELFEGIRYPVGMLSEDVPVTWRIAVRAGKAALIPKPVYCYFHRPNSITTTVSVSEKTFHNVQHIEKIYAEIRETLPELEPDAHYFRVMALVYVLQTLALTDAEGWKKYADQRRELERDLQKEIAYFLHCPLFSLRDRVQNLLIAYGLYRIPRKLFHMVVRREE